MHANVPPVCFVADFYARSYPKKHRKIHNKRQKNYRASNEIYRLLWTAVNFFHPQKLIPVSEPHPTGVRALRRKLAPRFVFYLDEAIKIPPRLEECANVQTNGSVTKMKYYTVDHNVSVVCAVADFYALHYPPKQD